MKHTSNRTQKYIMEKVRKNNVDAAAYIAGVRMKQEKARKKKLLKQLKEGYERWRKKHEEIV